MKRKNKWLTLAAALAAALTALGHSGHLPPVVGQVLSAVVPVL